MGATPGIRWAARRLVRSCERVVWSPWLQISKAIGPATHNVAEYRALIAGLELARDYGIERIRVYMDSELVVDQVNGVSAVKQGHLSELHTVASSLVALFKSIRISWVPREMNAEADRLVNDALGALD
jgi:ribonuclease HI